MIYHRTLINTHVMSEPTLEFSLIVEYCFSWLILIIIHGKRFILGHLIYLIRHRIRRARRLVNFFLMFFDVHCRLVAVFQPIVEIVAKLFQEIHIARVTILFGSPHVLPRPGSCSRS